MPNIIDVWLSDTLNISFDNGQSVLIPIDTKKNARRFREIIAGKCKSAPQTDGKNVYWQDGPCLSGEEIMRMVEG